jgi:hypothetical protein
MSFKNGYTPLERPSFVRDATAYLQAHHVAA